MWHLTSKHIFPFFYLHVISYIADASTFPAPLPAHFVSYMIWFLLYSTVLVSRAQKNMLIDGNIYNFYHFGTFFFSVIRWEVVWLDLFSLVNYHLISFLSKVVRAKKKDTGTVYALKIMDKKFITKENKTAYVKLERIVLDQLDHPGIVRLYFTFQDSFSLCK